MSHVTRKLLFTVSNKNQAVKPQQIGEGRGLKSEREYCKTNLFLRAIYYFCKLFVFAISAKFINMLK